MYERFTDRARKVMALANQETQRLNHDYIGPKQILHGLAREKGGVAAIVLRNLVKGGGDDAMDLIKVDLERKIKPALEMVTMGKLPNSPEAKKVIEFAIEESRSLGHDYVGTEHLLLGLLREDSAILKDFGVELEQARKEIVRWLAEATARSAEPPPGSVVAFKVGHRGIE